MKNKSFSGKYILYVIIFMVTAIVTFISMHYKTESAASVLMSEATLPVVMAKTEAGTLYNAMHGYTCEVDYSRLSTDLTLLPSDKKLAIAIDTYCESVSSISYRMVTYNQRNFHIPFSRHLACQHIKQAMGQS